jgi:hypothetical protein
MIFLSCEKEEGKGGQATITGKVYAYDVDNGIKTDSGYIAGVRVYISYGDNTGVDDNTRTDGSGIYTFNWLQKGTYKVWVVSECDTCPLGQNTDYELVEISEKKETKSVRDLIYVY